MHSKLISSLFQAGLLLLWPLASHCTLSGQRILQQPDEDEHSRMAQDRPRLIRQNDTVCDAGSAQWTGTVPIDDKRDMFFWYFESRHAPEDAPLVIWLNGGPGASSLLGALYEIGPCSVTDDGQSTTRSDVSWTEFANILFIDQPIGIGFSDPQDRGLWTENLRDGAADLDKFLDLWLRDYFPKLLDRPIHLAGESFGGKYCPVYADMMRRKLSSVVLVNAMVNPSAISLGIYHHFCAPDKLADQDVSVARLNASACAEMEEGYTLCEKYGRLCDLTYDNEFCSTAFEKCGGLHGVYYRYVVPGGENPYDDRTTCIDPPICGRLGMEQVATYLNKEWVQNALGFEKRVFKPVNMDFNLWWGNKEAMMLPSTREIARLLDEKKTRVLVLNGNNDVIVSTEGILRAYNSFLWSGYPVFSSRKLKDWFYQNEGDGILGGQFKTASNLAVVTVNGAGHMSPHDQPHAISKVMQAWLGHSDQLPFDLDMA